ncbi:MAG: primosomal protein N' [Syntrophomonadaceae bacterium]|jgi:primosomal protein N' (replication factor Y)|nr:primosomal protein N' [Syntrophomonadaceae bacterium]
MKWVEILVDLPLQESSAIYHYAVPDHLLEQAEFGRRVTVELGNRNIEGFIISQLRWSETELSIKPIIKVLDLSPIFDQELYDLARWMADNYLCPLSTALKSMIPPILHRKRGQWVVPLLSREDMISKILHSKWQFQNMEAIVEVLYGDRALSLSEALGYTDEKTLHFMAESSWIEVVGKYSIKNRPDIKAMVYRLALDHEQELDLEKIKKKSPRQAEFLQLLNSGPMEMSEAHRRFAASSIKSLLNKGYISMAHKEVGAETLALSLNREQKLAVEAIQEAIRSHKYKEFLLHGVTASGKTEVYLQAIQTCLDSGRSALVLVPEIALTRHIMDQFIRRFPNTAVLHSNMAGMERYESWKRIRDGESCLVLGTRSAVFAPLLHPGLIIIDEEHENTYKQEDNPKYHAAEVARQRAKFNQAVVVYGSATPSLDTYYRAVRGEIALLEIKERIVQQHSPLVHIDDQRKNISSKVIGDLLAQKIRSALDNNSQCILFLNRRGYSPISICRQCGAVVTCPFCSVSLNYHQDRQLSICHYCSYQEPKLSACRACGSTFLDWAGYGTQKVEEEIKQLFPQAKIARLDLDSSKAVGVQEQVLRGMKTRAIDILIGTQMVAKGLDFPAVSLMAILNVDAMLNLPDYRAGERAFQLIVQAAGRAGRGELPGEVVIQTYNPDHPIIGWAVAHDYEAFYKSEIEHRKLLNYPPFTNIMRLVLSSRDETAADQAARNIQRQLCDLIDAREEDIDILGPAPCPLFKLRNRYRQQIIIKCDNMLLLKSIGERLLYQGKRKGCRLAIDINPLNML